MSCLLDDGDIVRGVDEENLVLVTNFCCVFHVLLCSSPGF